MRLDLPPGPAIIAATFSGGYHSMTDSTPAFTRRELLAAGLGVGAMATLPAAAQLPNMPTSSRELWLWVRSQPVFDQHLAYLDVASAGPTLRASMAAEYRARETQSLGVASVRDEQWTSETERLTGQFASFLGCEADELLFTRGAGEAISTVAAGLDLAAGDEVITTTREHPAAISPWLVLARRRGIVVKQVELPAPLSGPEQALGLLAGAVTERTKVLAFSHVQYADGALLPVRELCSLARQRNIITVVDGAQAIGMLEVSLSELGCDFYACAFHKWLNGSRGTGALYVRREMLDRLWPSEPRGIDTSPPLVTPTRSVGHADAPATLHKLGTIIPYAWPALRGVEAALEFQKQVGRAKIEARVRELAIYARLRLQQLSGVEILTPARPGLWAGIVTFRVPGRSATDLAASLARTHRVHVRDLQWPGSEGALRASLHILNSHDDIDTLVSALQQALR
jgi:selenocysteine lyase/cysteine desulfurase